MKTIDHISDLFHADEEVENSSSDAYMLTTIDNPYSPWTQWDEWFAYDLEKGYGTCAYLARIASTSPDMTDEENAIEISKAIDEIIGYDVLGIYRRAYENE